MEEPGLTEAAYPVGDCKLKDCGLMRSICNRSKGAEVG